MNKQDVRNEYFNYLYSIALGNTKKSYKKLLLYLHSVPFVAVLTMDENRICDGIECRYRYSDDKDILFCLDGKCTILEMMVGLSIRIEEEIMYDPEKGDRTSNWFKVMLNSLGLEKMTDYAFDISYVKEIIDKFLNREYELNGAGGLFKVKCCRDDLREVEIWYQAMWYLNELKENVIS